MIFSNRKYFIRKNEATLLPFLVLWITVSMALPVPGTSSVSFTTYRRVPLEEWVEFYRNRGESLHSNKPVIPGRVREGKIPFVHYSYQIQHPSHTEKPERSSDQASVVFNEGHRPSHSDKLIFPTQRKQYEEQFHQPISFPVWPRNSGQSLNQNKLYGNAFAVPTGRIYFPTDKLKQKAAAADVRKTPPRGDFDSLLAEIDTSLSKEFSSINRRDPRNQIRSHDRNRHNALIREFSNYLEANPVHSSEILEPKYSF